jgi:hypothetical protein
VPDKVQALSDDAVRLRDAALLAGRQLAAARAEAKQAVALDAAADRAAAAGRPLPELRVAAEAAEAVELAQRRSAAASQNPRDHRSTGDVGGRATTGARFRPEVRLRGEESVAATCEASGRVRI